MARYLSPEWFTEMRTAASKYQPAGASESGPVTLRETVTGTPDGDVSYLMTITATTIDISLESEEVADVTFTQDYGTASAMHRGELTTQDAFFAGRVRVAGHLNTLLENSDTLQGINSTFDEVRQHTTY